MLEGAWRAEPPPLRVHAAELDRVATLLHQTGSGALTWWRLRHTRLAGTEVADGFHQAYRLHTLEAEAHALRMLDVLERLDEAGLDAIVVKGWAIARHYPEAGLRPYSDLDLVVRPGQTHAARAALAGPPAVAVPVDVHDGPARVDRLGFEALRERSERVLLGKQLIRVLGAEDHLRVLALHALRHGIFRPVWLVDLAVALEGRGAAFDWSRCLGSDPRRADWVLCALALAQELLGARADGTPAGDRVRTLPAWLRRAVLRNWARGEGTSHLPPIFVALMAKLGRPRQLWDEACRRWDRPVQATMELGGPFDGVPRWLFQVAAVARRVPEIGRAVRP